MSLTMRGEKHVSLWVWAKRGAGVRQKVASCFGRLARQNLSHGARRGLWGTSHVHRVVVPLSLTGERGRVTFKGRKILADANTASKILVDELFSNFIPEPVM